MGIIVLKAYWRPSVWITCILINSFVILIHWTILKAELKQRKKTNISFATKGLKIFSIGCIIAGLISIIFRMLAFIPGTCYFGFSAGVVAIAIQFCFMGYYQLSRLYYCFANDQIYSDKGYPDSVFIIMYIIGPVANVNWLVSAIFYDSGAILPKCGINDNYDYYQESIVIDNTSDQQSISIWLVTGSLLVPFWDVLTLFLYIYKLKKFRYQIDGNEIVDNRILFILRKTLLLTLFYEIIILLAILVLWISQSFVDGDSSSIVYALVICVISVVTSYSMYLMMDHNKKDYVKFLTCIKKYRLNYLCCCYFSIVTEQLLGSREAEQNRIIKKQTTTMMSRVNINDIGIKAKGNEHSVETKTVVEPAFIL